MVWAHCLKNRNQRERVGERESQLVSNSKVSLLPDIRKTPWSGEGEVGRSQTGNKQTQAFLSAWNFLGGRHQKSDLTSLDLIFSIEE